MNVKELEKVEEWAVKTFGVADLGDPRRTDRLVKMAAVLEPIRITPGSDRMEDEETRQAKKKPGANSK